MLLLRKPSRQLIHAFLERQEFAAFSYVEIGASRDGAPAGFDLDHNRVLLGNGRSTFESACAALRRWEMFPKPWTRIEPAGAPIRGGTTVAMLAQVFGLWWMNACRIVYVIDEPGAKRRFGFAYGTLPGHVECGEERFLIEQDAAGTVWYDVRAFSRPRFWLVRIGYPLVRRLQRRFVAESLAAMQAAIAGANPATSSPRAS